MNDTEQLTARELAEREIAEEASRRREDRVEMRARELEREQRREEEARQAEERRREAADEFARLSALRGELADKLQGELEAVLRTYREIRAVDLEQHEADNASRERRRTVYDGTLPTATQVYRPLIEAALFGETDPYGGASFRERDPLATDPASVADDEGLTISNVSDRCAGTKGDGSPCSLPPMTGSDFCSAHDPHRAEQRRESASKAGRARHGLGAENAG